jgi:hypothetical protein
MKNEEYHKDKDILILKNKCLQKALVISQTEMEGKIQYSIIDLYS